VADEDKHVDTGKRTQPTRRDYAITAAVVLLFLWWLGVFNLAGGLIGGLTSKPPVRDDGLSGVFMVVVPLVARVSAVSGDYSLGFSSTVRESLTVREVIVGNKGGLCTVETELPLRVAPGGTFSLEGSGCGVSGGRAGDRFDLDVEVKVVLDRGSSLVYDPATAPLVREVGGVYELTSGGVVTGAYT